MGVGHPLWVSLRLCNTSSGGRHPRASEYRPGIALPFLRLLFIVLRACRPKYLSPPDERWLGAIMWVLIGSPPFSFMRWNREQKLEPRDRILSEHLYERQKYKAGMRIRIKARRTRYPGLGCFSPHQIPKKI